MTFPLLLVIFAFLLEIFCFGNQIFIFFTYSLCRFLHRCINLLVLDSGDSSQVPGTLANDVFYVTKSYCFPYYKDQNLKPVFFFHLSTFPPSQVFKTMQYFGSDLLFLQMRWGAARVFRQRTLYLARILSGLINNVFLIFLFLALTNAFICWVHSLFMID